MRRIVPLAALALYGCQSGGKYTAAVEIAALPGVSVAEPDGAFLRLKRADDANNVLLLVDGHAVDEARLRPGQRFTLADGGYVAEAYELLLVSPQRITLRRERVYGRQTSGSGIETVDKRAAADLVTLAPYDLE